MRRPHRAVRPAVLALAAAAALAVLPGIAQAQPEPDPAPTRTELCPDGSLCTWPERDYAGDITEISDPATGGCRELARPAVSSVNDSGRTAVFYAGPGCTGGVVIGVEPGRRAPNFAEATSVRMRLPGAPAVPGAAPETAPESETAGDTAPS